jgi:hypothetical protein
MRSIATGNLDEYSHRIGRLMLAPADRLLLQSQWRSIILPDTYRKGAAAMKRVYTAAVVGGGAGGSLSMAALAASERFELLALADISHAAGGSERTLSCAPDLWRSQADAGKHACRRGVRPRGRRRTSK